MSTRLTFHLAAEEVFALHGTGEFRLALGRVSVLSRLYPERSEETMYWQACLHAQLDEPEQALNSLRNGLEQGIWWPPDMLTGDPDLASIRKHPDFDEILSACKTRLVEARTSAKSELTVLRPKSPDPNSSLVLALHSRGRNPADANERWLPVVDGGSVLACLRSSQQLGMTSFGWDDPVLARQEISEAYQSLVFNEVFDQQQVIIAGISQGGTMAIEQALFGDHVPVAAFIAVVPAIRDESSLLRFVDDSAKRDLRGWIIAGENDYGLDQIRDFHRNLTGAGIACGLDVVSGLGHDFPRDFERRLPDIISFVLDTE